MPSLTYREYTLTFLCCLVAVWLGFSKALLHDIGDDPKAAHLHLEPWLCLLVIQSADPAVCICVLDRLAQENSRHIVANPFKFLIPFRAALAKCCWCKLLLAFAFLFLSSSRFSTAGTPFMNGIFGIWKKPFLLRFLWFSANVVYLNINGKADTSLKIALPKGLAYESPRSQRNFIPRTFILAQNHPQDSSEGEESDV